jgi:axial budding pattern protein 2
MRLSLACLALAFSVALVGGDLIENIPLRVQLPQIAHVGSAYTWTINPETFANSSSSSSPLSLSYNASGLPTWVTFDAATQTFSGSPVSGDEGQDRVTVTASLVDATSSDGEDTSITSSFILYTIDDPAPTLDIPIAQQLVNASSLGSKNILPGNILHIPLGWSYSIGFEGGTFSLADGDNVYMSASVNGSTILPSWMTWSADTYTLYGVAPDEAVADGNEIDFVLTGSNKQGYGGTSDTLKIIVSAHALSLDGTLRSVNASVGDTSTYQIPITALELDGRQNNATSNPVTITPDLDSTPWITYDNSTSTLSGAPPFDQYQDANSTQASLIPLVFSDSYGNNLSANLTVNISPYAFTEQELPDVYVQPGGAVNVSLSQYLRVISSSTVSLAVEDSSTSAATVQATFDPVNASSWLAFDSETMFLTGTVPSDESGRVKVDLDSTNANNQTSSAYFYLTTNKSDTGSGSGSTTTHNSGSSGLSYRSRVVLAGALGGLGGLILLILLMICCRRHVAKEMPHHKSSSRGQLCCAEEGRK